MDDRRDSLFPDQRPGDDEAGIGWDKEGLLEAIRRLPEVREDKVRLLSEKIRGGRYRIDLEALAERMLEEIASADAP